MKKSIGHSEGCRNPRCRGNCATAHNGNTAKEIVVDQCKKLCGAGRPGGVRKNYMLAA